MATERSLDDSKNQHSCYYSSVTIVQECGSLAPSKCFRRLHAAISVATPELTLIQVMTIYACSLK